MIDPTKRCPMFGCSLNQHPTDTPHLPLLQALEASVTVAQTAKVIPLHQRNWSLESEQVSQLKAELEQTQAELKASRSFNRFYLKRLVKAKEAAMAKEAGSPKRVSQHEEKLRREQLATRHVIRELESVDDIDGAIDRVLLAATVYLTEQHGVSVRRPIGDITDHDVRPAK